MLGPILSLGGDALKFGNNFILQCMWRAPYYDKTFTKNWASSAFSRHDLTLCKVSPFLSLTYLLAFFCGFSIVRLLERKFPIVL